MKVLKMTIKFRSGFEERVYHDATEGFRKELVFEPRDAHLYYTQSSRYIPDFRLPNGILIECKGRFTARDRGKMLRVKRDNPFADIRFVFQRANNRLTSAKSSITYGEWADKHGFKWSSGFIPLEWFEEDGVQ